MRALLVPRPEMDGVEVYLYHPLANGARLGVRLLDSGIHQEIADPSEPGMELPLSLFLATEAFEALAEAMAPTPPDPTVAGTLADALADTRTTRDRLLDLVDRLVPDGP